jgi:hypothetical protein
MQRLVQAGEILPEDPKGKIKVVSKESSDHGSALTYYALLNGFDALLFYQHLVLLITEPG